jgi:hypothetical protein
MAEQSKGRMAFRFVFWAAVSAVLFAVIIRSHYSGQMASWYYHTAAADGYAVQANAFGDATKEAPALLRVGKFERIEGLQAVPVKKGDRLPANANGIILSDVLKAGKRATLEGEAIKVTVPWEVKTAKGFKFKDTFKHKGIETWPWAAVWNVVMVIGLGLALGFMAEGFTDIMGIKLEKIRHFEGH